MPALPCASSASAFPAKLRLRSFLFAFLALASATLQGADRYAAPIVAGELTQPSNRETSGLAASQRTPDVLWTHNDSGGDPVLFALRANGSLLGRLRLTAVDNHDWEDLASFTLDGHPWLLIADTGDNQSHRDRSVLHVVAEPDADTLRSAPEISRTPAYSIHFRYEDGPRDCEAVAVDPRERAAYLLSKRDHPPRLYRLPLSPATIDALAVARRVGEVPHLPKSHLVDKLTLKLSRAGQGRPTALDFLPDGSAALVLTYGGVFLFPRRPGAGWPEALAAEPEPLPSFSVPQAEGACFADGGRHIYLVSESKPSLLRYDRTEPAQP